MSEEFDAALRFHMTTAMRAAGLGGSRDQESIVINTMMPKIRRLIADEVKASMAPARTGEAVDRKVTRMEFTALVHGARAWSAQQSGDRMNLTADTFKTHRSRLFKRLGTSCIMESVVLALRQGIITMEDVYGPDADAGKQTP